MMAGKEELGLTLSLGSSTLLHHQPQLNLMPFHQSQNAHWTDLLASSDIASPPAPPHLRGIDVNRAPVAERESDEEAGVSSPNSTLSSLSGKRGPISGGDGISDEEDADGSRKKLRLSKDQSAILEESFKEHSTLNPKQKVALAKQLNLRPRQVEVWFQNRRARTKLKQTEVDCEFLKRCCDNLTEENRRLQKEVAELRALKMSPQFYMQMTPPTTLTMCPSCERVNNTSSSSRPLAQAPPPAEQHYQQRSFSVAGTPGLPWAPMPVKGNYMDVHNQRL